jgi:hypothetical protein
MNASLTFDKSAAIAATVAGGSDDAATLAGAFPVGRKADVCRLLAESLKEKANRTGLSASATLTKALETAKGFAPLELQSLKAFWQLAVTADSAVNSKAK